MICNLCKGSGNLISCWPLQWWDCPKCKGHGATHRYADAKMEARKPNQNKGTQS